VRVADYLIRRLADNGIDTVFGITGGGIMHLIDALTLSSAVRFQPVHHEEFAGICADGYARSGKKFGVAFATTGPGAAHLFTATAASWQDSVPTLLVVGQVKTSDSSRLQGMSLRQNGTFEFDTIAPFSFITKKSSIVRSAEDAVSAIEEAIILCQKDRPGPVLIEIPLDVQGMLVPTRTSLFEEAPSEEKKVNDSDSRKFLDSIREALCVAQRPIFLFGSGVVRSRSENLIDEFSTKLDMPYVVTQFARGAGNIVHSLYLGSPGIKANRSANMALAEADLIIAIGTSLHQQVIGWNAEAFRSLPSYKIWTEIDDDVRMARQHLVDKAFSIESSMAIRELIACVQTGELHLNQLEAWRARARVLRDNYLLHFPVQTSEPGRFSLYSAVTILSNYANLFRSVVTDAGIVWYVVPQHFFPSPNTYFISSGSFGSMGMALPLAIGSATATGETTLCITGDGSLMTCLSELATLASSKLPIVLMVNSNNGYLSIRTTHDRYFEGRKIGTDSSNGVLIPNVQEIAEAFNLGFMRASTEEELEVILKDLDRRVLKLPLIVEILTLEHQLVEPVISSRVNPISGQLESGSLIDLHPKLEEDKTL
jgi:acetolactate synthase-1/2/3 large subunit